MGHIWGKMISFDFLHATHYQIAFTRVASWEKYFFGVENVDIFCFLSEIFHTFLDNFMSHKTQDTFTEHFSTDKKN